MTGLALAAPPEPDPSEAKLLAVQFSTGDRVVFWAWAWCRTASQAQRYGTPLYTRSAARGVRRRWRALSGWRGVDGRALRWVPVLRWGRKRLASAPDSVPPVPAQLELFA